MALTVTILAAPVLAGTPSGPRVLYEHSIGPGVGGRAFPANDVFDPIVATDPTDKLRIAVVYNRYLSTGGGGTVFSTGLRITHDKGETWTEAPRTPAAGSGRAANWHSSIAWGPSPTGGSRLYWADTSTTCCEFNDHRLSIAYTDNEGSSWSHLYVEMGTPATAEGGYPDVTVDNDPHSPDYGVVYAIYNWFPNQATEPGMRLLASPDFGAHWYHVEIPPLSAPAGYPWAHRIGYRVRPGRGGAVYASFYQADLTHNPGHYGRMAFGLVHVRFWRATHAFTVDPPRLATTLSINSFTLGTSPAPGTTDRSRLLPRWTHGLDVNQTTGRVYMAVADYHSYAPSGHARGIIKVGESDDHGVTWRWRTVPSLAPIDGRAQSAHKPTLVLRGPIVFVGFHVITDVPAGTNPRSGLVTVGNAYSVSYDGGLTFTPPAAISAARWDPEAVDHDRNGAGLRDRAAVTADGRVFYSYGDGRWARPSPSEDYGESRIYGALISLKRAATP